MQVDLLVPEKKTAALDALPVWHTQAYTLQVFDDTVLDFFERLSKSVLKDVSINRLPEITALAFWLRKTNLQKLKQDHVYWQNSPQVRVEPIGKVFHICPANVDTMFVYSMAISLLCGNMNVLRISKRVEAPSIHKLFQHLNDLLQTPEFTSLQSYITILSYGHNDELSKYICQNVNARIIWGGDNTIEKFKSFNTNPRCKDICFADRISFTVINSKNFNSLTEETKKEQANLLYNDSFSFDQMGCASPQTICFLGEENENKKVREELYTILSGIISLRYEEDRASLASLKLNRLADESISHELKDVLMENSGLVFASLKENNIDHKSCGGGFFYVMDAKNPGEITGMITSKHQTLSYIGLEAQQVEELVKLTRGKGIDRIVPVGMALDFSNYWDGYKLTEELTNKKFIVTR